MVRKSHRIRTNDTCKNVAHDTYMDIFFALEPTRYDVWVERFTLNVHCGIFVLEISLKGDFRPSQTALNKRRGL